MGRHGRHIAQAEGAKAPDAESPVDSAIIAAVKPKHEFGPPAVTNQPAIVQPKGIPMDAMQEKSIEAGFVPPQDRMNPEYHAKAVMDRATIEKQKKSMGYNQGVILVGASPNAPGGVKHHVW